MAVTEGLLSDQDRDIDESGVLPCDQEWDGVVVSGSLN